MTEIVVKHFRRSSVTSEDKELVTEIVEEESDTGQFLQRMEETRLDRPCFQTIDMRGRVAGECRHYTFNDRVHYLDDISFQMFEMGLQQNRGVYTVGTFEAIVGGPHTLHAQRQTRDAAQRHQEEVEKRRQERARQAALERSSANNSEHTSSPLLDESVEMPENPEQLTLGYFRKRDNPRLQYAGTVTLQCGNIKTAAVSKDISVCGAQVRIRGLSPIHTGQDVSVNFDGLSKQEGTSELSHISYAVVGHEERDAETLLRLQLKNPERQKKFREFIQAFIEQHQRKYKLDVEDEYHSVLSWYYERCYAESASLVPLYIEKADAGGLRLQAVAMSKANAHLVRFFCTDQDNYNFTPLCLSGRLARLEQGQPFLLAMYRERGDQDQCMRIHSVTDFECAAEGDFARFVKYASNQAEHCVVKVSPGNNPVMPVPDTKIDEVSQRLQYKSEQQMGELRDHMRRLELVACMVDLTQEFIASYENENEKEKLVDGSGLFAWVGGECRDVKTQEVKEKLTLDKTNLCPLLIRFGYAERRREDRYLAETTVEVRIGQNSLSGMSRDISTRGMRIQLDKNIEIKKGASVKVGLTTLQKKKSSTNLLDIPYRVVNFKKQDDVTLLMLERVLGKQREGLKEFFVELITTNQHKLGVDVGDIWSATASRVYESLLALNTPSLPFFIGRSEKGGAHLQFIGIPQNRNALTEFFYGTSGYDFRPLSEQRFITAIYDSIQILSRQNKAADHRPVPFELTVYIYKEFDEPTGETFTHMATELDFPDASSLAAFESRLSSYTDWRCMKVISTFTTPLAEKTFEKMIEPVRIQSRHRAIKLSEMAHSLVGYGELIDITDEWKSLRAGKG